MILDVGMNMTTNVGINMTTNVGLNMTTHVEIGVTTNVGIHKVFIKCSCKIVAFPAAHAPRKIHPNYKKLCKTEKSLSQPAP